MTNQRGTEGAPSTYCLHVLGQVSDESEGYGGCSMNLLSACAGAGK